MQEARNLEEAYRLVETLIDGQAIYINNFDGTRKVIRKVKGEIIVKDEVRRRRIQALEATECLRLNDKK